MPKPRKYSGSNARGECGRGSDGEKIVDTSCDIYDDAGGAAEMLAYAAWLTKASRWLTEEEDDE